MRRIALALAGLALTAGFTVSAAAEPTAAPSPGVLRAQLADAIADEERAWRLLARSKPRRGAAKLALGRSLTTLRDIRAGLASGAVRTNVDTAISEDISALANLDKLDDEEARRDVQQGIFFKSSARWWLQQPDGGTQCADGRDNDRDGLRDSAFDSGCSGAADKTERSPATCSLDTSTKGRTATVSGTCSGPFQRVEVALPAGTSFDTATPPAADLSVGCRYAGDRQLECLFRDGTRNPRHRLRLRFKLETNPPVPARFRVTDFRNRRFAIRRAAPPPRAAFQIATTATYVHRGTTSDVCVFVWTRPGQPPLRGGVTLTGPSGEQTKAFTTLGGEAKTLVRFTVTERARYVADVTLAGKTAQTAVTLGLAPTTSGEFSCLP